MARGALRVVAAVVAAVVVAELAVLVLWPREGVLDPLPVSPEAYFTQGQIDRAEAYRAPQTWLSLGVLAVEIAVLAWVVARPPRVLRRLLGRAPARRRGELPPDSDDNSPRPLVRAAAVGAVLSLLVAAAALPLQVVLRARAIEVGLVTQGWAGYAFDVVRSWAIAAAFAALGAIAAVWLLRRAPRTWWLWGSGIVVAFGFFTVALYPVVVDPLFNDFRSLEEGELRRDTLELARRAGVRVGEVYVMDASRRTTAANAYVAGLGASKRIVLYDTLLEAFPPDEVRLVVAHELGHQFYSDLPQGLLFLAVVTPFGLFAAHLLVRRVAPQGGVGALPALGLAIVVLVPAITWVSNQLSRQVEARADTFSLQLTDAPRSFIDFERRITVRNVGDPDPPDWRTFLFSSHPPAVERIGMAEAWARGRRP
ncbi:MAG: M48 family metallopeptidase [Solirubrobacterales bacterium]|nr:M48 family metallopeptidase [Solirubrobacterales bacterium]